MAPTVGIRRMGIFRPVPTVAREDVQSHAWRQKVFLEDGSKKRMTGLSATLNESDRDARGEAKRFGYLRMYNNSGEELVNSYFKYCVNARRPYLALHRTGVAVEVDLTPVMGAFKEESLKAAREADLQKAQEVLRGVLKGFGGVQVVNWASLDKQLKELVPGPTEGLNDTKIRDTAETAGPAFTVYTSDRQISIEFARAAYAAVAEAFGLRTRDDISRTVVLRKAVHEDTKKRALVKGLRRLLTDPVALRNLRVPYGGLEGFSKAEEEGRVESLVWPMPVEGGEAAAPAKAEAAEAPEAPAVPKAPKQPRVKVINGAVADSLEKRRLVMKLLSPKVKRSSPDGAETPE